MFSNQKNVTSSISPKSLSKWLIYNQINNLNTKHSPQSSMRQMSPWSSNMEHIYLNGKPWTKSKEKETEATHRGKQTRPRVRDRCGRGYPVRDLGSPGTPCSAGKSASPQPQRCATESWSHYSTPAPPETFNNDKHHLKYRTSRQKKGKSPKISPG